MAPAVTLLQNLLAADPGAVSRGRLRRLQTAATLDGKLDRQERGVLTALRKGDRLGSAEVAALDAWLKAPKSPEVAAVRKAVPAFDARVAALAQHAKPGDLVFWRDTQNSTLGKLLGEFPHVSLALGNGKFLDTMTLEGVSISTTEGAVAKTARRMKAGAIAIGRPARPLTAAQVKALEKAAKGLQGRDYALLSPLRDALSALSCSRSVYEALKAVGLDLAPEGARTVRNAVMPGDLMKAVKAVGTIGEDGVFRAATSAEIGAWKPTRFVRALGKAWDFLMTHVPALWPFVMKIQDRMVRKVRL